MYWRGYWYWSFGAVLAAAGLCLGIILAIPLQSRSHIYTKISEVPTTTVALVLGASVYQNGALSPVLQARADTAVALYKANKVSKILVTGDNSDLSHNEVNPTGKYLLTQGIPKKDIFLDHAGFDTYSSMYRARDVFAVHSLTIVTQSFHLPRAVLIARNLGLDAVGIEAADEGTGVYNTVREVPAVVKAVANILFERVPKYLGPQFPIEGDGSPTWADTPLASSTPAI